MTNINRFEGLDLVGLMELMHGIVAPEAIAMTPQTTGWLIIGLWMVVNILLILGWQLQKYRQNQYRRDALAALAQIGSLPKDERGSAIATLLKQTALVTGGRESVASLSKVQWRTFLKARHPAMSDSDTELLVNCGYDTNISSEALVASAESWIRSHK